MQRHLVMALVIAWAVPDGALFLRMYVVMGPMAFGHMSSALRHLIMCSLFSDLLHRGKQTWVHRVHLMLSPVARRLPTLLIS